MDTYLVKQPSTEKELQQIINAIDVCCVSALRYGGKNPDILSRISPEYCDYAMHSDGTIVQRDSSVAVMQDEKDMWASKLEPKKEFLKSKLASLVGRLGIKRR